MARRRAAARRGWRITFGAMAALVLIGILAALIALKDGHDGSRGVDDATVAGVRVGSGPAAATGDFFKRLGDSWDAAKKVHDLETENKRLRQWRDTALALSERMERYEDLLKMPREAYGVGTQVEGAVSARLVLDPGGPFKRTMLANAGAMQGVKAGYVAINENGLVGRVVAVGQRSSRILLLDDHDSHVPVMGLQSRTRAILDGDASTEPKVQIGVTALTAPRLDFQVPAGRLLQNERIVTSGDGQLYPRGLFVGEAAQASSGVWRVRLGAASKPIDFVRLLPFAPIDRTPGDDDPNLHGPIPAPAMTAGLAPADPRAPQQTSIVVKQPKKSAARNVGAAADEDAPPPVPDALTPPAPAAPPQ